jgi:pyridoxal 5'-phosphate synthase pdxS subunit
MNGKRYELNKELAQMLKGGVIMDVTTPEQAKIAEAAGACAVMALERIPADIRAVGGISRMSDPKMIKGIQEAVSIPVMAKCRIGHFVEAQILEAIEIDYIDESEVLSPTDDVYHIDKTRFKVPFVCGAKDWIVNSKLDNFFKVREFVLYRRHITECAMNSNMVIPMNIVI